MMENKSVLYATLTRFGDFYPLKLKGNVDNIINSLDEKFKWIGILILLMLKILKKQTR